jgi:predicted dehydrogenase
MITLAIVGAAHCHTPWIASVLKNRIDAKVKLVYDHDPARARATAKILGSKVASRASAIWSDDEVSGVFILSETNRHEKHVMDAARAKKHVFVEKPLGVGSDEAFRMARALDRAGVIFMTGYRTRSEGVFLFLREQIKQGNFGRVTRIRYVNCHGLALNGGFARDHLWMADPRRAGGGAFLDLGTHAIDSLLWLMDEPVVSATSVTARAVARHGPNCEELGEGLLEFGGGAIGSLAAAWVDVNQPVRCVISGTEGHAHVTDGKLYFESRRVKGAYGKSPWTAVPQDSLLVFERFIDAVAGRGSASFISPREAANVCAVQEALARGAKERCWVKPRWLAA